MAYSNQKTTVLKDIEKGSHGDVVRISKIEDTVSGTVSMDIRLYYENEEGELAPTKKGCRLNAENTYEVMEALLAMLEDDEKVALADLINQQLDGDDTEDDEEVTE